MINTKDAKKGTKNTKGKHEFDGLSGRVIGAALEVHKALGPGLLESAYMRCMEAELKRSGIAVALEVPVKLSYKGVEIACGYRLDMVIENELIVELKSVEALRALHEAQILTYMRLSGIPIGLLINFNTARLRDGIKRFVI